MKYKGNHNHLSCVAKKFHNSTTALIALPILNREEIPLLIEPCYMQVPISVPKTPLNTHMHDFEWIPHTASHMRSMHPTGAHHGLEGQIRKNSIMISYIWYIQLDAFVKVVWHWRGNCIQ